jgi:hypothetical protein
LGRLGICHRELDRQKMLAAKNEQVERTVLRLVLIRN